MRVTKLYLNDILRAIDSASVFIVGMDFAGFKSDQKTQFAVVRALEVIGEASKMVPDEIRLKNTEIPWKKMGGMRDRLIHAYFGVDLELVWKTTSELLPALRPQIQRILDETQKD